MTLRVYGSILLVNGHFRRILLKHLSQIEQYNESHNTPSATQNDSGNIQVNEQVEYKQCAYSRENQVFYNAPKTSFLFPYKIVSYYRYIYKYISYKSSKIDERSRRRYVELCGYQCDCACDKNTFYRGVKSYV